MTKSRVEFVGNESVWVEEERSKDEKMGRVFIRSTGGGKGGWVGGRQLVG